MNKKSAFFWLIYTGILSLIIIIQRVERVKSGLNLARENNSISAKKARNDYFQFAVSKLKSPKNLLEYSQKRLNLNIPEPDRVFLLGDIKPSHRKSKNKTFIAKFFSN